MTDEPDYEDREQQRLEREEIDPRSSARAQDAYIVDRLERAIIDGRVAPDVLPSVCLHPEKWRPPLAFAPPPPDPQVVEYRRLHRPFRSAFRGGMVAGERARRIMGHVGGCHARGLR